MEKLSLQKNKIKIILFEGIHPQAEAMLRADGYEQIVIEPTALSPDKHMNLLTDAHIIGIRSASNLQLEALQAAKKLIAVGCFCIGTDQVDLTTAEMLGIPVFNAPYANTRSVAELVLGEMILLLRGIPQKNAATHRGQWLKSAAQSFEARGKTLGIIGYGHIGTQLGILAEHLGMQVLFYDIENKLALGNNKPVANLTELLSKADVVSLHVPDTAQTRGMITARELAAMKPGSILINAARGQIIDIDALCHALNSGHLAGAALDVFPQEPKSNKQTFDSPLCAFDQVLLTPHIGGSTQEAQANIAIEVAEKLIKYSNNGSTVSAVNFPEVALPQHHGTHRILHIHKNEPGVLARINEVFSSHQINISAQFLRTSNQIGYVVTDIDQQSSDKALKTLQQVPGTVRTRILW